MAIVLNILWAAPCFIIAYWAWLQGKQDRRRMKLLESQYKILKDLL
jgi:hypothetical protein